MGSGELLKNIFGSIFLLLAMNCSAGPLQLSGDTGKSILETIANNTTQHTKSDSGRRPGGGANLIRRIHLVASNPFTLGFIVMHCWRFWALQDLDEFIATTFM